ncbi:hypothetical protein Tco_0485775, partial [Tanacetum coccineum]
GLDPVRIKEMRTMMFPDEEEEDDELNKRLLTLLMLHFSWADHLEYPEVQMVFFFIVVQLLATVIRSGKCLLQYI